MFVCFEMYTVYFTSLEIGICHQLKEKILILLKSHRDDSRLEGCALLKIQISTKYKRPLNMGDSILHRLFFLHTLQKL